MRIKVKVLNIIVSSLRGKMIIWKEICEATVLPILGKMHAFITSGLKDTGKNLVTINPLSPA